jgi:CRISPR-associated protein Cas2
MVVVVLERASPSIRGDLTRWLLEVRTGVFVGRVNADVRDRLWERLVTALAGRSESGAAVMIHVADTEQGYTFRLYGDPSREVAYFDGLELVLIPRG